VDVSYGLWFLAFLPCALAHDCCGWWFAMKVYPAGGSQARRPHGPVESRAENEIRYVPLALKATALSLLALGMWLTDYFHHIPPSVIALSFALIAFLPFVNVLNARTCRRSNLMPVFSSLRASMSTVAQQTGALKLLTDSFSAALRHGSTARCSRFPRSIGRLLYHFATASEISMLATSLPVLMEYAKAPSGRALIGMVWSFSAWRKIVRLPIRALVIGYSLDISAIRFDQDRRDSTIIEFSVWRLQPPFGGRCSRSDSRKLSPTFRNAMLIPRMKSNSPA